MALRNDHRVTWTTQDNDGINDDDDDGDPLGEIDGRIMEMFPNDDGGDPVSYKLRSSPR